MNTLYIDTTAGGLVISPASPTPCLPPALTVGDTVSLILAFLARNPQPLNTGIPIYNYLNYSASGVVFSIGPSSAPAAGNFSLSFNFPALFNGCAGTAVDPTGNIYVADTNNNTIRKITPAGIVTTFAGTAGVTGSANGTGAAAKFNQPTAIAIDLAGNLYVTDTVNNTIRKITPGAVVSTLAGTAGVTGSNDGTGPAAQFNQPNGITIDAAGNLYITDTQNYTIRVCTSGGAVTTLAGQVGVPGSADGTGTGATFDVPLGITFDGGSSLYVCDGATNIIRQVSTAGVVVTFAGTAGVTGHADGNGPAASFNEPYGIVYSGGTLFVCDSDNSTIRAIDPGANVTTFAGTHNSVGSANGNGAAARFNSPIGISVDAAGNLYVGDSTNQNIRLIDPSANVTTFAGLALTSGSRDGGPYATGPLVFNLSSYDLSLALNGLPSVIAAGGVTVSGNVGGPFRIRFATPGAQALITVPTNGLFPTGNVTVATTQAGTAQLNACQVLTFSLQPAVTVSSWTPQAAAAVTVTAISGTVTQRVSIPAGTYGGSFTLTTNSNTTVALPFNAQLDLMQTALNALPGVTGATVIAGQNYWDITIPSWGHAFTGTATGLMIPLTLTGSLALTTQAIADLLAGNSAAQVPYMIQTTAAGVQTIVAGSLTLSQA